MYGHPIILANFSMVTSGRFLFAVSPNIETRVSEKTMSKKTVSKKTKKFPPRNAE
jgi:hypothetical protein